MALLTFLLGFVTGLVLLWSILPQRGPGPGLSDLSALCAHLGWSLVALFSSRSITPSGNVKALRAILTENVMTGDKIIVNGPAAKLAIYFPNNFVLKEHPAGATDVEGLRFIAVAATRLGRTSEAAISLQDPTWNVLAEELQNRGSYRVVLHDDSAFLLERNEPLLSEVNRPLLR